MVTPAAVGDQRAGRARAQLAVPRLVALEHVVQLAGAARLGHELGAEPDQPARRHEVLHPDPAGAVVHHVLHAALAEREQLADHAEVVLGRVDRDALHRLLQLAVHRPRDDLRLADGELEPLAAHHLDEDGELELAAALDLPHLGALGVEHADRDVADQLLVQAALRSSRAVSLSPSWPDSGDVLMPTVIDRLGSSTRITGSGRGSSGSASVSPIVTSAMPAIAMISPGPASSASTRSSASVT